MENQQIIEFPRQDYEQLCIEMREILRTEKELAVKKAEIRENIITMAGGERMEYGIKLQCRESKGAIDYKKFVVDSGVEPATLEFYRKEDRAYWEIRSY